MVTSISDKPDSGMSPGTAKTVSDKDQFGLNPMDAATDDTNPVQKTGSPIVKNWPGPTADSRTVNAIGAVTAAQAGPNVLVATGANGKLPASILPGAGFSAQTTPSRTLGTIYQNTTGNAMMVTIGVALGGSANVVVCDASPTPVTIVAFSSGSATAPDGFSITFLVLPNYYYQSTGGTLNLWTEWY